MHRVFLTIFVLATIFSTFVNCQPKVPCYFIFGDSLSDPGNNNNLKTTAKANYPPYGVDFPGAKATGRFTNGRTTVDFITEDMGFNSFIKPFRSSNLTNQDILRGVNLASGGAGILEESGSNLGDRISFNRQVLNYKLIILKLQFLVQGPVNTYLNKCLFSIDIGSNDYINNYFLPQNNLIRSIFNPHQYAEKLVAQYKRQLQAIYNTGARKIAISGLGRIGCTIAEIFRYNATSCVVEINNAVDLFNNKLASLVDNFNSNLHGAQFTFFNVTSIQDSNPLPAGIVINSPCCKLRDDFQCEPFSPPCGNRDMYAFMDGFHPTQFVFKAIATIFLNTTNPSFAYPRNINQLVAS